MKIKSYDEVAASVLSPEYVLANGVPYDDLCGEFYWNSKGKYCYDQQFDKPMDEGGKPFTGIAYELDDDGALIGYREFDDGWETGGTNVAFYPSSRLRSYTDHSETGQYTIAWHENGVVSYLCIHHRKTRPEYFIAKKYDENGKILEQRIYGEYDFTYHYDNPDPAYEVTFHKNGAFKRIKKIKLTSEDFYAYYEYDDKGFPSKCGINPNYAPAYLSLEKYKKSFSIKTIDKTFREEKGVLKYAYGKDGSLYTYSGRLCFKHPDGWIEKILEYHNGVLLGGPQCIYYANGKLKEEYFIEKGRIYGEHIRWYESGTVRDAVIFSKTDGTQYRIMFDEKGNVTGHRGRLYER